MGGMGMKLGWKFALAVLLCPAAGMASADDLIIAGFGGKVQEDLAKTLWQPAADETGATLIQQSHDGLAGVRVQVQSGSPGWDIAHLGADECAVGAKEGLFQPLDYNRIDASGIADAAKGADWVGINSYSVVLAWRKDLAKPPHNWADFWNVADFPGRRALGALPQEMMEIAVLADGVQQSELYPLDVDRALAAIDRIRPDISVWWTSGAQSAQLIADGEVDMIAIWGSRVAGVIDDGAPVDFTYDQGLLGTGCLAILKGASHADAAQKFIARVVSPELQSRFFEMMPYYGPTNAKAFEVAKVDPAVLAKSNMAPENAVKQVNIDVGWWADNNAEVREEYRSITTQ